MLSSWKRRLMSDREVVADTVEGRLCVFLAGLYRAEQSIAEQLVGLGAGSPPWLGVDPEKAFPWVELDLVGALGADRPRRAGRPAGRIARGPRRWAMRNGASASAVTIQGEMLVWKFLARKGPSGWYSQAWMSRADQSLSRQIAGDVLGGLADRDRVASSLPGPIQTPSSSS